MKNMIFNACAFVGGIGIGFFAGWKIQGKRLDKEWAELQKAKEKAKGNSQPIKAPSPVASVEEKNEEPPEPIEESEPDRVIARQIIRDHGYDRIVPREPTISNLKPIPEPYIINEDEFGSIDSYDTACLTYYTDGRLVRDDGEEVDVENTIGLDTISHFTETDDLVYVRNDFLESDYEVLYSGERYEDDR